MRYIACELDPHWHAVAEQRLAEMDGGIVITAKPRLIRAADKQRERGLRIPGPGRTAAKRRRLRA